VGVMFIRTGNGEVGATQDAVVFLRRVQLHEVSKSS